MMDWMSNIGGSGVIQVAGEALAHFLWQGAAVAILLAVVLRMLQSPSARYAAATIAMALLALCPLITAALIVRANQRTIGTDSAPSISALALPTTLAPPAITSGGLSVPDSWQPWLAVLVIFWFCGVAAMGGRHLFGWLQLRAARLNAAPINTIEWTAPMSRLMERLAVRSRVQLAATADFDSAVTFGAFRPLILVPISLLSGLTAQQIELILAHELAHIRRRDYLFNLLQTAVETVLFYHPAVWWVGAIMRREREYCCDDLAVEACGGNRREYAKALMQLEVDRGERIAAAGLAPAMRGYSVLDRARRLLQPHAAAREFEGGMIASLLIVLALCTTVALAATAQEEQPPAAAATQADAQAESSAFYFIGGAIRRPGGYLRGDSVTLAEAIERADGLEDGADKIKITNPDKTEQSIDITVDGWKTDPTRGGVAIGGGARIRVGGEFVAKPRVKSPVNDADWEKTYRIGGLDLLSIRVTSRDLVAVPAERSVRVAESGKLALADVKVDVSASGMTLRELADHVAAAMSQRNLVVDVKVDLIESRNNGFFVAGMVKRPGEYVVVPGKKLYLSYAVGLMAGLNDEAKVINILSSNRPDAKIIGTYNAADFRNATPPANDPIIEPGQMIVVGERSVEAAPPATNPAPAVTPASRPAAKVDVEFEGARPTEFTMEDLAEIDPQMRAFLENRSRALFKRVQLGHDLGASHPSILRAHREFSLASQVAQEYFSQSTQKRRSASQGN